MAPSLCEYHLENIILYSDASSCYFNKNQIAKEIYIGDFRLYFDYEENIYLEKGNVDSGDKDENLLSLW
ncbi:MAG: hypothetical protein HY307_00975, partial [Arcobacter sp.]|nr:hypothetical protein [Arcobacter sp.]